MNGRSIRGEDKEAILLVSFLAENTDGKKRWRKQANVKVRSLSAKNAYDEHIREREREREERESDRQRVR
jgi:pantothenate kinase-related protein Tda10